MDKKTLLYKVADKELNRLLKLDRQELEREYYDWFGGAIPENVDILPNETLRNDLLEDYMRYREDESIEELQEMLK